MYRKSFRGFTKAKQLSGAGLAFLAAISLLSSPAAKADGHDKLKIPSQLKKRTAPPVYDCSPDLLLIMPNASSENEEIDQILKEAHGTIVGSMGEGKLKCLIYRTEKGKMLETEKKFTKDKEHFKYISRNYKFKAQIVPNDPQFTSEWHLGAINAPRAWDTTMGNSTKIAIFDSGCQASIGDLSGKTQKGYDATSFGARMTVLGGPGPLGIILGGVGGALSSGAQTDVQGHGTMVATTAAASANNSVNTAGVAPGATVYPVQIAGSGGWTDDIAIMAGLLNMTPTGNRIVNISYAAPPPVGFTNAALHAPLHVYMQNFHDVEGGLIFISSGNDGMFDPNPMMPYLNVVTAIDPSMSLTSFSNWGLSSTFTAPGQGIVCTARDGTVKTVNGTSFSSPIVASVAALVWNANPALPNFAVESILKASCFKAGSAPWTPYYGFGMPDASKAVSIARFGH
ncbi:MAG: S8 family serine peptidase [Candidatus Obscuribacterales bacterium]|nr:S8 family serine peptidase [Candidatus Obscuribacterales bacterium]